MPSLLAWICMVSPNSFKSLHAEADAFLASLDLHGFPELFQIPAHLQELGSGQACKYLVLLLGDLHMLALDLHQLQVKNGNPVIVATLALKADCVSLVLPPQFE